MGLIQNLFGRLTGPGVPVAKGATVLNTSGVVFRVTRLLGSSSALALITGSNTNLSINSTTGDITATTGLTSNESQIALVRETSGYLATEYPLTLTGQTVVVNLGLLIINGTLRKGTAASGITITGATPGSTITLNIAGLTVSGSGTTRTVSGTPTAIGIITATETLAGIANSPKATVIGNVLDVFSAKLGQIGFNVQPDWAQDPSGGSFMFLDRMKASSHNEAWAGDVNNKPRPPVDEYDYLTGLGDHNYAVTFISVHTPKMGQPAIRHVLRHNGTNLQWSFDGNSQNITIVPGLSTANRIVFDVPYQADRYPLFLKVSGATVWPSYKPNNPIETRHGISLYELAHESAYLNGELVHPDWVNAHIDTAVLRFMDLIHTNHSQVAVLADKASVGNFQWGPNSKKYAPVEVMVEACNKTKAHMHFCVPHGANLEWVNWHFAYIRDNLDPTLLFMPEYSNEVWNPGFSTQFNYTANFWNTLTGQPLNNRLGYGYLAARNVQRAYDVFGPTEKYRVFGLYVCQAGVLDSFTQSVDGVIAFDNKPLKYYFKQVSGGFYLGGGAQQIANPPEYLETQAHIDARVQLGLNEINYFESSNADPAQRVVRQALIDQIRHGNGIPGWDPIDGVYDRLPDIIQAMCDFAKLHEIPHVGGYEGQNFHINAQGPLGDAGGRFVEVFWAAANDTRISGLQAGSLMRDEYAMLRSKGMTCQTIFMDFGSRGAAGMWTCKPSAISPDTPLWSFYRWYQQNHPDDILFEINMTGGGLRVTKGSPATRRLARFGGCVPSADVVITSTLPSGVTYSEGTLSFDSTVALGTYPITAAATDGSGRTVTRTLSFVVALFDPLVDIPNIQVWNDVLSGVTSSGGNLTTWTDAKNGKTLTPTGTAPSVVTNGWDTGIPAIVFNNTPLALNQVVPNTTNGNYTLVMVVKPDANENANLFYSNAAGGTDIAYNAPSTLLVNSHGYGPTAATGSVSGWGGNKHVIIVRNQFYFDTNTPGSHTLSIRMDGTVVSSGSNGEGHTSASGILNSLFKGKQVLFGYIPAELDLPTTLKLEAYLKTRFGTL